MDKIIIIIFLFSFHSLSYTLNNNFGATFKNDKIAVRVADTTSCAEAGLTIYEFEGLINQAVEKFWNTVPTSRLRLFYGGFYDTQGDTRLNTAKLCAYTDPTCDASVDIPPVSEVVISCNNNTQNFESPNILAVTVPNIFSGRRIKGSVILINNRVGSAFSDLSENEKVSVISHEIGHAIGLGHSKSSDSLMFFQTITKRSYLGQDDIDGVTALYPLKFDACGIIRLSTADQQKGSAQGLSLWQILIGFFIGLVLTQLYRLKALTNQKKSLS